MLLVACILPGQEWRASRALTYARTLLVARCVHNVAIGAGHADARLLLPFEAPGDLAHLVPGLDSLDTLHLKCSSDSDPRSLCDALGVELAEQQEATCALIYPEFWYHTFRALCQHFATGHNVRMVGCRVAHVHLLNYHGQHPVQDYKASRMEEVKRLLIEQHRSLEDGLNEALTAVVVNFELLSADQGKALKLDLSPCLPDAAKRGIFAMYNYARIASLLRRFWTSTGRGGCTPADCAASDPTFCVPLIDLLAIGRSPEECLKTQLHAAGTLSVPKVCARLAEFANAFSKLYGRVKVLTDSNGATHARIEALQRASDWMEHNFRLLSLQPINEM